MQHKFDIWNQCQILVEDNLMVNFHSYLSKCFCRNSTLFGPVIMFFSHVTGTYFPTTVVLKSVYNEISLYWNQSNCLSDKNYKEHETTLDIQYSKLIYILYSVPHSASYRHLMLFARFRYDWNSKFSPDIFDGFFISTCCWRDWIF